MEETELVATVRALLRVRQAEAAQRAAEIRFAQFVHASPDVFWIYNVDTRQFEFVSVAAEEVLGHRPEDLKRNPELWFAQIHPHDRPAVKSMLEAGGTVEEPPPFEYRIVRADGGERWIRDKSFLLPGDPREKPRVAGLARDITVSKLAEQHRNLLINELNHRVKNTLAIVQAIASHTRNATSPRDFETAFTARLEALAKAHDLLTRSHWNGTTLKEAIDTALSPFLGAEATHRISASGPKVWLAPNIAVMLALAFHELATNATKYGALSDERGRVNISWKAEPNDEPAEIQLRWRESGGPPVSAPSRKGFGSLLMERVLVYEAGGKTALSFASSGLEFDVQLPLSNTLKLT
jgi:PAS domain S-box-containing protein